MFFGELLNKAAQLSSSRFSVTSNNKRSNLAKLQKCVSVYNSTVESVTNISRKSNMNSDSSSDELHKPTCSQLRPTTPIKKRKIRHEAPKQQSYSQKFKEEWLQNPKFKSWLVQHPQNKLYCKCKVCNVELKCGKSELEKHASTAKHKKNISKTQGLQSITSFAEKHTLHSKQVTKAEIKLSNFFAHHNVAFQIVEHLLPVLKECFPDSSILKDVQLGRTKTVSVIKNVIAQKETQDLANELKQTHFSVLVDESTDISVNKLLCVVVKYVNNLGTISDKLLELITIDAKSCTAENLFLTFRNCLQLKGIPLANIIGFASDNASVMIGKNNSFMTKLQAETDALIVLPCICHSAALIANNACAKLPRTPEEFVRSVASYFSVSAKRTAELAEMQLFFKNQQKKMLKLSATRWLSMQHAVARVLDNWNILLDYFRVASLEENSKVVNFIFNELNNSCTKAVLLFLKYFLNFFNTFNALFQAKKLLIQDLSSESRKIFKNITMHYIKPEYLNDLNINCRHPGVFLDLMSIDLGHDCNSLILELPKEIQISIRKSCLEFLVTAATEIQTRLPLTDPFFNSLCFLKPEIALNITKPTNLVSLEIIWKNFSKLSGIDGNKIDLEWKKIAIHFSDNNNDKEILLKSSIEQFWSTLKNYKNFQDEYEFSNIVKLAQLCMSLPHSNADTERVFSTVTDVKTKKRNKLGSEALNAVSVIRMSSRDKCCQSFTVSDEHIKLMSSKNLYK